VTLMLALCLALAEAPEAEVRPRVVRNDPRSQRPWVISAEAGWNSLAGVGAVVTRHLDPHLTVEAGVGLSGEGPKFGTRLRYNFFAQEGTPFLGAGFLYGTGVSASTYRVGPSPFLQLVAGLEYQSRGGFNWLGALGYAWLLRDNLTTFPGAPFGVGLLTGGGPVVSTSFGYAF
jgi:hypothetical protein